MTLTPAGAGNRNRTKRRSKKTFLDGIRKTRPRGKIDLRLFDTRSHDSDKSPDRAEGAQNCKTFLVYLARHNLKGYGL